MKPAVGHKKLLAMNFLRYICAYLNQNLLIYNTLFMKRKVFLSLVITTFVMSIAFYLGACKKNIVTPINNSDNPSSFNDPNYTAEARKIVGKIKKFQTQLVNKEYLTRGDSYMPIDSVIWNVEALFNAVYTFPEKRYLETVKQDLEFFVPANDRKEVLMSVVDGFYDEVIERVRQAYANDGIDVDKSLMAVDVEEGDMIGNNIQVIVHVVSGKAKSDNDVPPTPVTGPFGPGDCWYFGEYGGTCDDPSEFGDAAEIIEDSINCNFRGKGIPSPGYRFINVSVVRIFLDGNEYVDGNGDYYTYFYSLNGNTPLYLDYEMLNYYYNREIALILNVVPSDPVFQGMWPTSPAFLEVDITGLIGNVGNNNCAYHKNAITYCSQLMIPEHATIDRYCLL